MADPNIEIKIAATGGDAAAAEVRKVDTAVDSLSGGGGSGSGKGLKALAEETTKVSAANVKMGTGFQNVGYQVQDLAVQIGSGTSAFRAMGQQLPQLLSGFGPLGITLGTVAAVALPLAGAMFNLGESSEDAGEKAAEAAEKLEKLASARQAKVDAAAAAAFKNYLDSLDLEFGKINRNADELQRTVDVMQAVVRARIEVQSSEAALAIAKIDASDKTDAEKIQARAEVTRNLERQKLEAENEQSKLNVDRATGGATAATAAAALAAGQAGRTGQNLASQKAEAAALRGRIIAADQIPAATERAKNAALELSAAQNSGQFGSTALRYSPEQIAALQKKADDAEAEKNRLLTVGDVSINDRQRLNTLQGTKKEDGTFTGGQIAETQKAIADLVKAAADLAIAAEKARLDAEKIDRTESTAIEARGTVAQNRLRVLDIQTMQSSGKALAQDQQESDRDRLRGDLSGREQGLNDAARSRGLSMRKTGGAAANKTYAGVESALMDGTNAGELQKLGDQVREAASKNGAATTAFLLQIIDGFNNQAKEIETLKQKLKNK